MQEESKQSKSRLKSIISVLATAYGINFVVTMGYGIYQENKMINSHVIKEYHLNFAKAEDNRLDALRGLYRLEKTAKGLEGVRAYLERNSLGDKLQCLDELAIKDLLEQERHRLKHDIQNFERKEKELREELLKDPEYSNHSDLVNNCLIRALVNPFYNRF